MDIRKKLQESSDLEDLKQSLLDLDSEFRFKCRRCGKCCKNQDTIILNPRDIFRIARKQARTMSAVIDDYTEVYIGPDSRIPIVHLLPKGPKNTCPLLVDGRCSVHDCKPGACALTRWPASSSLRLRESESDRSMYAICSTTIYAAQPNASIQSAAG